MNTFTEEEVNFYASVKKIIDEYSDEFTLINSKKC